MPWKHVCKLRRPRNCLKKQLRGRFSLPNMPPMAFVLSLQRGAQSGLGMPSALEKLWKVIWEDDEGEGKSVASLDLAVEKQASPSQTFLSRVLAYTQSILKSPAMKEFQVDFAKMIMCKVWPYILAKASKQALDMGLPALAAKLEAWASFLLITPCKFEGHAASKKLNQKRMALGQQLLDSMSSVPKVSVKSILASECFIKDGETKETFKTDLLESVELTSKGSQWLSAEQIEKQQALEKVKEL